MKFDATKTAFGRHETFGLRYSWLTKGYQKSVAFKKKDLFNSDDATVELGVGKNMVSAIRYWLRASQVMDANSNKITGLGELIFNKDTGFDPYLEDEATLWLIHWSIATNSQLASSWYWFFNKFHKPEFTGTELNTALTDWVKDNVQHKVAAGTLKNDALLVPKMYSYAKGNLRISLEDKLDVPLAQLNLVSQSPDGKVFLSKPMIRPSLPIEIIGYAVAQLMETRNAISLPIEELMYSRDSFPAIGSIFRLTENDLIAKLEVLTSKFPKIFDIRESAGIHQLYVKEKIAPQEFLRNYYVSSNKEVAA